MSQQGWNRLAAKFETSVCDITSTSAPAIEKLVALARPNRRQTLVDAGCGIGTFVERFGDRFGKVVAFDFANAMVKRARKLCNDLEHAEWASLPLEDAGERFGSIAHLAVCMNVITAPKRSLRERQWQSLGELVRPGGHLLVVVPSFESAEYVASLDNEAFNCSFEEDNEMVRRNDTDQKHYSRRELRRTVTNEGFDVIALRKVSYPWGEDGLELGARKTPWDWACLARKNE
jgi:SAM-dependent methyltransferase